MFVSSARAEQAVDLRVERRRRVRERRPHRPVGEQPSQLLVEMGTVVAHRGLEISAALPRRPRRAARQRGERLQRQQRHAEGDASRVP
jgi:hypothetical protein